MKHEDFIEPVEKFRGKPLSRRIHGDHGQVFLSVNDIVHKTNRSISRMLHFGRAEIACHENNGFRKVYLLTVPQRQDTFYLKCPEAIAIALHWLSQFRQTRPA